MLRKLPLPVRQAIRAIYFARLATQVKLAKAFGVSQSSIHRIVSHG
jgi:DNA-binding transcriptional regulator LsrR (DeoR family)